MNTVVETEATRKQVAKHFLLGADGNVCEDFEDAVAIRYVDIASGTTIDFEPKGEAQRMLALFGARTLATNEASAARQKDGSSQDQIDAINERFAGMQPSDASVKPVWADRTREGGPRIDLPTLATAMVEVFVGAGKVQGTDEAKTAAYTKVLANLEADKAQVTKARSNPDVQAAYDRLRNKKTASVDDLAGLL